MGLNCLRAAKKLDPFGAGIDVLKQLSVFGGPHFSLQHCDNIDNSAGAIFEGHGHDSAATAAISRTERLQFPAASLAGSQAHNRARDRNDAVDFRTRRGSLALKRNKQPGIEGRHIAGRNQVPLFCSIGIKSGFNSGKRPAAHLSIAHDRKAEVAIQNGVSYQRNVFRDFFQFFGNIQSQRNSVVVQKSLIRAHSEALAPNQNEARKGYSPTHQEMISLQYVTRRQRFAPCSLLVFVLTAPLSLSLQAEPLSTPLSTRVATRTTLVVRTDARTGRLVRSVVVAPRPVALQTAISPAASANSTLAASPAISGSISDMIDAIAERNQVEAPLVHSVIKAESNYNPGAISPKGAQGLMQLIPSTAHRFGVSNSFDIQQNIEGGVKYLKFLIELYNNDYRKVIAAYNAGEGAVAKYGGIPPYSETINYVYRVGKNLKAARQFAELKAAERKAKPQPVETATVQTGDEPHSILAVTGDDGRIYYKIQ